MQLLKRPARRRLVPTFLAASILVAVASGACKSTVEGTAPPPCSLPTATEAQDDFCEALAAYDGRCGHCADCTGKNLQNCSKRGATISAAHRAALIACKDVLPCNDDPDLSQCVLDQMRQAAPTAVQAQAKDAYCGVCGATHPAECSGFFTINGPLQASGPGYSLLLSGDATATRAITTCASKCEPLDYGVCVALLLCADSGGDYCVDSGFCAVQPTTK
jgi:hypothetical protein